MSEIDFKKLARPIGKAEVKSLRKTWKDKKTGEEKSFTVAYITSRTVMNRLDRAVGVGNWRDEYVTLDGHAVLCTLYVRIGDEWVGKSDVGTPSEKEPIKGAHADAFKRAAVKWGIGRELYQEGTAFEDEDEGAPVQRKAPDFAPPASRPAQQPAGRAKAAQQAQSGTPPANDVVADADNFPALNGDDVISSRNIEALKAWIVQTTGAKNDIHAAERLIVALTEYAGATNKLTFADVYGKVSVETAQTAVAAHMARKAQA